MTPEPTVFTVREQIIRNIVAAFSAPPDAPEDISWSEVTRRLIDKTILANNSYIVGIYDTTDRVTKGISFEVHDLKVVVEFHARLHEGDDPSIFLNHCLGQVVKRVAKDTTLGGLALNAAQAGSELDIEGAFDKYVSGVSVFTVSYRCRPNDLYTRV